MTLWASSPRQLAFLLISILFVISTFYKVVLESSVNALPRTKRPPSKFDPTFEEVESIVSSLEYPVAAYDLPDTDDSGDEEALAKTNSYQPFRKALVVASMKKDNVSWIQKNFRNWETNIYTADDPRAALTVHVNKGREAMVYLTYIIDNYDRLPDAMLFLHSSRYQWHNDDPIYDGVPMIRDLNLAHIVTHGYANLRCTWVIGCPSEIRPWAFNLSESDVIEDRTRTEEVYADAFRTLFPELKTPQRVGVSSGAQFAVSRHQVLQRPRRHYEAYRDWLVATSLPDSISGRVLEYAWHIMFGREAVHCPDAGTCYCQNWGLCDLNCTERECEGRYTLPPYSNMPEGWPEKGRGQGGYP